jgi:Zn-finger nucleic acid-binding protein
MRCPQCEDAILVMSERQGIEIDHCPKCRGVWLDRGELDKIIERSVPALRNEPAPPARARRDFADSDHGGQADRLHTGHRRKSWLGDFFD